MKYEDFVIRIEEKSGDDFKVSIESPACSGRSRMSLPFDADQMAKMLRDLSDTFRGSGEVAAIAVEEVGGDGGNTREMEREAAMPPGKNSLVTHYTGQVTNQPHRLPGARLIPRLACIYRLPGLIEIRHLPPLRESPH